MRQGAGEVTVHCHKEVKLSMCGGGPPVCERERMDHTARGDEGAGRSSAHIQLRSRRRLEAVMGVSLAAKLPAQWFQ